ncbi:hypothetical protein MNBD_GAMMA22-213 [hydrothermal vent metagenome]|uniref:Uncharacterized protein n=1 Tax=hydrothermal vent metagenome TaxID=652676 RepID=A0A3B0ZS33_9ZZZZ
MNSKEIILNSEEIKSSSNNTPQQTAKQKQLKARKKLEDYFDEKELKESIGEFDFLT